MRARVLDGAAAARDIKAELQPRVAAFTARRRHTTSATIKVSAEPCQIQLRKMGIALRRPR